MSEIPKEKWKETFDRLSRLYSGWKTSVQAFGTETNSSRYFEKASLAGIVFIRKNMQELIELIVGDSLETHRTLTIFDPQDVSLDDENQSKFLISIRSGDADQITITLLYPGR